MEVFSQYSQMIYDVLQTSIIQIVNYGMAANDG